MEILTHNNLAQYENAEIPKYSKSNFYYSFGILPKEERIAIHTVYSFCSYIDDIVDSSPNNNSELVKRKMQRLHWWENEIEKIYNDNLNNKLIKPFSAAVHRFNIPKQYFLTLLDGIKLDLIRNRYETFDDLKDYCFGVASIVGLISIEIFGYKYEETKQYAVNLGYALQLTNILRDIKVDKNRNYIYIPTEDLERFNYSENDIFNEVYNDEFIEMMRFQTSRVREYYHKARSLLRPDERPTILSAEIMDAIYYRLLEKIELREFNVYQRKIRVSSIHKLMISLKHWLSIKMFIRRLKKQP